MGTLIPGAILQSARKLPHPGSTLAFASLSVNSVQLLSHSPVLFALLVNHAMQNQCNQDWFAQIVASKRADQLQLVSRQTLQSPKLALKFIQRLDYQCLQKKDLDTILAILQKGEYSQFTHHQRIPLALLNLLKEFPFFQNNKWLFHLQSNRQCEDIAAIIRDILDASTRLNVRGYFTSRIIKARSVVALNDLQDALIELAQIRSELADKKPFPPAPVQGDDWIKPVSDPFNLYRVGVLQDNCVFDYLPHIHRGKYYIYQVTGKVNATLGVHIKYNGIVLVDQLLAASNKPVKDELHQVVKRWLQNSSFSRNRVFNNHLVADYKARNLDHLMSDYLSYSRPKVRKLSGVKYAADFKKRQMDQLMNDYADYCASNPGV